MLGSYIRINIDPEYDERKITMPYGSERLLMMIPGRAAELSAHSKPASRVYIITPVALKGIVKLKVIAIAEADGVVEYVAAPDRVIAYEPHIRELIEPYRSGAYTLNCLYEKSCGAVVFRKKSGNLEFLLIKNKRGGNWGFPKGHVEYGENEQDTAMREVFEETGLNIRPMDGFRALSEYHPRGKIFKQVVFFIAEMPEGSEIVPQQCEVDRCIWADYGLAMKTFRFNNDRNVLTKARNWLRSV